MAPSYETKITARPKDGLHLYHSPLCPFARRTRIMLEHAGIDYTEHLIRINDGPEGYEEHISAYGLVPALVHNGENVYESNIINEYLDEVFDAGLVPEDPMDRAHMRILMAYADDAWMGPNYVLKTMIHGIRDATPDEIDAQREKLVSALRSIDARFRGEGPWMMGDKMTLADIAFMTTVPHLDDVGVDVPEDLTRLNAWLEAVRALPAWQKVPLVESEDAVATTA